MKNPVSRSIYQFDDEEMLHDVEDIFAELSNTSREKSYALPDIDTTMNDEEIEDYHSCRSMLDEGEEQLCISVENDDYLMDQCQEYEISSNHNTISKQDLCPDHSPYNDAYNRHSDNNVQDLCPGHSQDNDELIFTGQSTVEASGAAIKLEKTNETRERVQWPKVKYHETEKLLREARDFDKQNNNMERLNTQSNGFWISSNDANRYNYLATDIDVGHIFYPPCPIWIQFVEANKHARLPYKNIPKLTKENWDGEYFEIFYAPSSIKNVPVSEWSTYADEIFREGRDYSRLQMPLPMSPNEAGRG